MGDPAVRIIVVDGRPIRTAVRGEGRPLLLVMGIGGNLGMWGPLEHALNRIGVQTISYDAPGTGGSPAYRRPRRMAGLARTAEHLIDTLGYQQVDVLGVSFGGGVAQQLARQTPARVRRLVLAATSTGAISVPGNPKALRALATPRRYMDPNYFQRISADLYGGNMRRSRDPLTESDPRFEFHPSLLGYATQLYAAAGWTSLHWLHRIRQPTLVLAGDDDPIIPLANGRLLARRIPSARLHVVPGGGHMFLLDTAAEIAPVTADFVRGGDK